ncbi:ABC transporter substrate-binding protein [Bacillus sp. OTU530]|uniref:ABC transporter substrate-binding protein n=1 Tax=Bacillus sp. OTU530 TaxID=3043862 RepID=UPI00313CDD23
MRKFTWLTLVLTVVLIIAGCGGKVKNENTGSGGDTAQSAGNASQKQYKIAISQIVEHPSLDATREGFLAALKDADIEEGNNLTVDYNNAQGDPTNNLSIAQKVANEKNDLVLAIATPSALAVAQQVKDTPVLFAAVTDPVGAKIINNLDKPGGNISGASDTNPEATTKLVNFIAENFPKIKTVGLVINEGESNAVVMADRAEKDFAAHGIKLIRAPITNTSEVKQAAQSLVDRVDAFYLTLDNKVVSGVDSIIQLSKDNKIPLFSSDRETVERGALATVGFKYYDHGYQVGQMAVDILKNGKKPGDMEVTVPNKLDLIINLKAAKDLGIEVTDKMKNAVADQAQNLIQ